MLDNLSAIKLQQMKLLQEEWDHCQLCQELWPSRLNVVHGCGNLNADLLFIAEKPGRDEDLEGVPMQGKLSGAYHSVLAKLELTMDDVWTTNCICCKTPENREPYIPEMEKCFDRLRREILIVDPLVIVIMGQTALQFLVHPGLNISKNQGKEWSLTLQGVERPVTYTAVSTFNPAMVTRRWSPVRNQPPHYFYKAVRRALTAANYLRSFYGRHLYS